MSYDLENEKSLPLLEKAFLVGDDVYELLHHIEDDSRSVIKQETNETLFLIDWQLVVTNPAGDWLGSGTLAKDGWVFTDRNSGELVRSGSQNTVVAEVKFAKHLLGEKQV